MNAEVEKLRLHFIYCAIILGLVIIAIATDRWTAQQKFTEYLSNAATMTSLVLGLVAIFYSFIANDGLSRSLGNIDTVSENIRDARDQISGYLRLTDTATDAVKTSTAQMQDLSAKVDRDLAALTSTLADIGLKSAALHDSVGSLPDRLDRLENKVIDATKAVGEKVAPSQPLPPTQELDATSVKRFLELSPLSGNLLAIACVLAAKSGKPFLLSDFTDAIAEKIDSYLSGYLAAMNAAQIIRRDFLPGEARQYQVKSVHSLLASNARTYFVDYVERIYKDKREIREKWLAKLSRVEALFAN